MRWWMTLAMLLGSGCDQVFDLTGRLPPDAPASPADAVDAPLDAADEFGAPVSVALACPGARIPGDVSLDRGETMFVYACSNATEADIHIAPVEAVTEGGTAMVVVSTSSNEGSPELAPTGLELYYLILTAQVGRIERMIRTDVSLPFVATVPGGGLNTIGDDRPGSPDEGLTRIVIARDLELLELENVLGTWTVIPTTTALNIPGVGVFANPHLSADGLTLVFAGGTTSPAPRDLYIAHRTLLSDNWSTAQPIAELNTAQNETDPWLSADGRRIYFARNDVVLVARK